MVFRGESGSASLGGYGSGSGLDTWTESDVLLLLWLLWLWHMWHVWHMHGVVDSPDNNPVPSNGNRARGGGRGIVVILIILVIAITMGLITRASSGSSLSSGSSKHQIVLKLQSQFEMLLGKNHDWVDDSSDSVKKLAKILWPSDNWTGLLPS